MQSIISINQIGLAVWGWLFSGALIGYEISTRARDDESPGTQGKEKPALGVKKKQSGTIVSSTLIAGVGAVVGLLIAVPPLSADTKWRTALASKNVQKVEAALAPGLLNPPNSYKYANAVQILENSKLYDLAVKYARIGVEFNPNNFDSWRALYLISKSTPEEKSLALENMKRLDPKNPNVAG